MENVFRPRLDILPPAQLRLWPELARTPGHFVLYGGTAIALHLMQATDPTRLPRLNAVRRRGQIR